MKTMKNKYSHISSLNELEAAQRQLKKKFRRKEHEVRQQVYGLRDDYSAPHLFGMTMRSAQVDAPLLQAIRFLKKKIASL